MKLETLEWFPPRRCFSTLQKSLWSGQPFKGNLSSREIQANEIFKYMMEGLQIIQPTLIKVLVMIFHVKRNKLKIGERFIKYSKIFQGYSGWLWEFFK